MEPKRAKDGSLVVRKDKFPNGMKALADYAHSKKLKFGICKRISSPLPIPPNVRPRWLCP